MGEGARRWREGFVMEEGGARRPEEGAGDGRRG